MAYHHHPQTKVHFLLQHRRPSQIYPLTFLSSFLLCPACGPPYYVYDLLCHACDLLCHASFLCLLTYPYAYPVMFKIRFYNYICTIVEFYNFKNVVYLIPVLILVLVFVFIPTFVFGFLTIFIFVFVLMRMVVLNKRDVLV